MSLTHPFHQHTGVKLFQALMGLKEYIRVKKMQRQVVISLRKYILLFAMAGACLHTYGGTTLKKLTFDFYGHLLEFDLQADFYSQREKLFDSLCAEERATGLLEDSLLTRFRGQADAWQQTFRLDGMAYLMLVKKAASVMASGNIRLEALLTYAVLKGKGFDVLLGETGNRLTLYGHTGFGISNVLYVTCHGKVYYDLSFDQRKPLTSDRLLPLPGNGYGAPIGLDRLRPPELGTLSSNKIIPFEYEGSVYFFTVQLNRSLVSYYNELPAIELGRIYLNYGLSEAGERSLIAQLRQATAYMSKAKTVDFILCFVQNMDYARDEEVLGEEKFSFPEESLAGDYTDCEDRSMLFAYLVREVAHLQSIGLMYPTHMNVAVESWKKKKDSDFSVYEMDFIVCEPSAKGLKAGQQTMDLSTAIIVKW